MTTQNENPDATEDQERPKIELREREIKPGESPELNINAEATEEVPTPSPARIKRKNQKLLGAGLIIAGLSLFIG